MDIKNISIKIFRGANYFGALLVVLLVALSFGPGDFFSTIVVYGTPGIAIVFLIINGLGLFIDKARRKIYLFVSIALIVWVYFATCVLANLPQSLLCDCFDSKRVLTIERDGKQVTCTLYGLRHWQDTVSSVYGTIEIVNLSTEKSVYDLRKYRLQIDGVQSKGAYINSIIDFIYVEWELLPEEKIKENVYWVFDKRLEQDQLQNMELIVTDNVMK